MKKLISVVLAVMMLISCFAGMSITASAATKTKAGWQEADANGVKYLVKEDDGTFSALDGWQYINGVWYYFENEYRTDNTVKTISGTTYAFGVNGAMIQGGWGYTTTEDQVTGKITKNWVFADGAGELQTGLQYSNGKTYFLDETTYFMVSEVKMPTKNSVGDDVFYYFNETGAMITGWFFNEDDQVWYYGQSNGELVAEDWAYINGVWYYFNDDAEMVTGYSDEAEAFFNFNGAWVKAGWCYFIDSTDATQNAWGYIKDGELVEETWMYIDGVWYYFDADAKMVTGGYRIESTDYLFAGSGAWVKAPAKGWNLVKATGVNADCKVETVDTWYYIKADGTFAEDDKLVINGKTYSFIACDDPNKSPATTPADEKEPETGHVGLMVFNTTFAERNTVFAYGADGAMIKAAGWNLLKATPSWLTNEFGFAKDSWVYAKDAYGVCATDKTRTIGGKVYSFYANGVMVANTLLDIADKNGVDHTFAFAASGAMCTSGKIGITDEDGNVTTYYVDAKYNKTNNLPAGAIFTGAVTISKNKGTVNIYTPELVVSKKAYEYNGVTYKIDENGLATPVKTVA